MTEERSFEEIAAPIRRKWELLPIHILQRYGERRPKNCPQKLWEEAREAWKDTYYIGK